MASRAAILRAARAGSPGAGQTTLAPQGSGSPWIGQLPSYGSTPGQGYSYNYGPFLPRPPGTFSDGAFGPFSPILPVPVDTPPDGAPRAQPRRFQYEVGYNLPVGQPGTEGYKLASFQTLKTLADTYSILRTCLERRKNEIRSLDWDVVLTPDAAKAYQGHPSAMRDFGQRRAKAKKFFSRPDPNYYNFESWLHALTDQVFTIDALSVYMCPKRARGMGKGLLGSDLDCLWLLDGSTIRPLLGLHGETPAPPAPGYQQFLYGVPRADLSMMVAGLDLEEYGLSEADVRASLRSDQLIYHPYLQRPDTPYGFSLVEQALIPIMTGLRKQAMQLNYFDESTTPRVWLSPGDASMTPNQIRELQDAINAVAGDLSWAFKVMVVPPNSKIIPQKDMEIVDDADNWIANEVAMACDISPVEIGLIPKVSAAASPFAAREMAQASRSIHERTATKPTLSYLTSIFDYLLQIVCGQDDLRFVFNGMEQTQDIAALTDTGIKQVQSGIRSIDEVRDDLHLPPWGLPETSGPIVLTQMGPVPLGQAAMDTVAQMRQAITGAHDAAGGHASQSAAGKAPQRKALPAGTSGQGRMNGPVTQRQARRGGALAPAHATGEGAPGHSGGKPVPKAALAELEALGRHLAKGMPVAEWVPEHIPGAIMAMIGEDLDKGLSAGYVIKAATALVTPPQQSPQQAATQAQATQAQIAARFQAQLAAAFAAALAAAKVLIAAWWAGSLAVTAAVLAQMIGEEIRKALLPVLTSLWTQAWEAAGGTADPNALDAFLTAYGEHWAALISGTGSGDLLDAIRQALAAGDPQAILAALESLLSDDRTEQIAISEVTRAWNAAALLAMKAAGLAYVRWQTRNDSRVCPKCRANQDASPVAIDSLFPSGTKSPPLHPRCRCVLLPALPPEPQVTGKVLRREVGLNGQETWTEYEPEPNGAGGGGRVFQPHRADGTVVPEGGVPGSSAGGEPPRWDGSEPFPVTERAPDADDDAAYGEAAGTGTRPGEYWPAPYMDGWWPSPHGHGSTQAGTSSPGGQNGRPPNGVGKRNAAARFLEGAPQARPAAVFRIMQQNFPPSALKWVRKLRWAGPVDIPFELMDTAGRDSWAASHEEGHVGDLARKLRAGEHVNPVIGVVRAGHNRVRLIDGRHRTLAAEKAGKPVRAYVGFLDDANEKAAYDTYLKQFHSGSDPENKSFTAGNLGLPGNVSGLVPFNLQGAPNAPAYVAGLAVRAADTGRVLMLQRAVTDSDPAAGLWELPGGHAEDGESLLAAAMREWAEETGRELPQGELTGHWEATNGIYAGFVLTIPREADLDLGAPREVDNPDGDAFEAVAWHHPDLINGNPACRPELRADYPRLMAALDSRAEKSGGAAVLSDYWTHQGHPGPTQYAFEEQIRWGTGGDFDRCTGLLMEHGHMDEEQAHGYCNLRHHQALGYWPAQHARMERGK